MMGVGDGGGGCAVVEKSAAVSGSRVVQSLLHEAYRFQAIRPDAADVDEHFPGNHRVKARPHCKYNNGRVFPLLGF